MRLGILGTSRQAELAVVRPARSLPEISVVAVAGRTVEAAQVFAARHKIPHVFESAAALVASPLVEAVYVAVPNALHLPAALEAVRSGRHVLVEKPLALDAAGCLTLANEAAHADVAVLEGIMVQHHPWHAWLEELVASGCYGAVRRLATRMSFAVDPARFDGMPRLEDGGGVFRDVAPYWLQLIQSCIGLSVEHQSVTASYHPRGFDLAVTAEFELSGGAAASLDADFHGPYWASHEITFEQSTVRVLDLFRANVGQASIHVSVLGRNGVEVRRAIAPAGSFVRQLQAFHALTRDNQAVRWEALHLALERQVVADSLLAALTSLRDSHSLARGGA